MSVGLLESSVKKRAGRPKNEVPTEPVRIRSDIVQMARWIALAKGESVGQLISDMVEARVRREYDQIEKPERPD